LEFAAISMSIGLVVISGILAILAKSITRGELPPNAEVGFRTKATKASAEAWYAGHDAVLPYLRAVWPIGLGLAAITLVGGFLASADWVVAALGGAAYLVVIALLMAATVTANRAARAAHTASQNE